MQSKDEEFRAATISDTLINLSSLSASILPVLHVALMIQLPVCNVTLFSSHLHNSFLLFFFHFASLYRIINVEIYHGRGPTIQIVENNPLDRGAGEIFVRLVNAPRAKSAFNRDNRVNLNRVSVRTCIRTLCGELTSRLTANRGATCSIVAQFGACTRFPLEVRFAKLRRARAVG